MSNQFPSVRYHRTLPPIVAKSQEEADALGKEWADTPAAFENPEDPEDSDPGYVEFEAKVEHLSAPKRKGARK